MDNFVNELIRELGTILDEAYSMVHIHAQKNNDVVLNGIRFDKKGTLVSPIVYVDEYYEDYTEGSMTMGAIMHSIIKQLSEKNDVDSIVSRLQQYDLIQYELAFALINYDMNREILKERPHKKFLDLAAVCLVRVETMDGMKGIVYVTHEMMNAWKIDEDTLFKQCMRNTLHKEHHCIRDIMEVLADMRGDMEAEFMKEMMDDILGNDRRFMFVLTNKTRHMGANVLLNQKILHDFAMEHDSNLIIYPSSLHEVIIVFEKDLKSDCMDTEMVQMINEQQVHREEWLSNSIYVYDREQEKLLVYQHGEPLCNNKNHEKKTA